MDNSVKKGQDLVSIIMPAYNAAAFIKDSILSVLRQTYVNWELLVVDDGSTDNTAVIVNDFLAQDNRIIYYKQANSRLGAARNTGFRLAKGDWIAFLDADDLWANNKLEVQLMFVAKQNMPVDVVFSAGYYLRGGQLSPYDTLTGYYAGKDLYVRLLKHNHIPVLSAMMRRPFSNQIGLQDTATIAFGNEDWDYWLRGCRADGRFLGIDQRLFQYRLHENGISSKKALMRLGSCYMTCKNYDRNLLCPEDRRFHQRRLLSDIPFIIKQALKTRTATADVIRLVTRILSIALHASHAPERNALHLGKAG